jgi:hypothetical protein
MPSGENIWNQLLKDDRRRGKGSLGKLQRRLWYALDIAECGLREAMGNGDSGEVRHWLHIFNQLSASYSKVALDSDLETRIRLLEDRAKA